MKNQPDFDVLVPTPTYRRVLFWGQLLTWGLLAATLAGRLGSFFFLFELASHFAIQYAVLAALLLVLWLYVGSGRAAFGRDRSGRVRSQPVGPRWLAVGAIFVLLINGWLALPWLTTPRPTTNGGRDLRLLHANVLFAGTDYTNIIRLVQAQSPDLFVLQEMTPESIRGVSALRPVFPYQYHIWSKGPCYILVGSRTPIDVDSSLVRSERVVSLRTTVRGQELALLTVHPQTPMLPSWFAHRNQQLAFVTDKARRNQLPTVVLGDFNISVFSPVYHRLFEPPGLAACRLGFGLQPTWPRFLPPMFIPIDHAFVNTGFRTANFEALDQPGSDHKAIIVDLSFAALRGRP